MFFEVHNKFTRAFLGRRFRCHGCLALSRTMKQGKLPVGWIGRLEGEWSYNGRYRIGGTRRVENHYCPACVRAGCSAATVARGEVRRIAQLQEIKHGT